jgi:hypothetical protein
LVAADAPAAEPLRVTIPSVSRGLTTDLDRTDLRPYFFWDEDISIAELHQILAGPSVDERERLLAKLLREARDIDVWRFVTPIEVAEALPRLRRQVGRRYEFWRWLIDGWRSDGLLPR